MEPILLGTLTLLGAFLVDDAGSSRSSFGLDPKDHARKIHPWVVRIKSATMGLNEALEARNTARVIDGLEDVWFWIGRVVCDTLSAGTDPAHSQVVTEAGVAVMEAYQAAGRARQFLLRRYTGDVVYIGPN